MAENKFFNRTQEGNMNKTVGAEKGRELSERLGLGSCDSLKGRSFRMFVEFPNDGNGGRLSFLEGTVVGLEAMCFVGTSDWELHLSVSNETVFGQQLLCLVGYVHPITEKAAWSILLLMFDEESQRWKRKSFDCSFELV
jgi:hypothetical protein